MVSPGPGLHLVQLGFLAPWAALGDSDCVFAPPPSSLDWSFCRWGRAALGLGLSEDQGPGFWGKVGHVFPPIGNALTFLQCSSQVWLTAAGQVEVGSCAPHSTWQILTTVFYWALGLVLLGPPTWKSAPVPLVCDGEHGSVRGPEIILD